MTDLTWRDASLLVVLWLTVLSLAECDRTARLKSEVHPIVAPADVDHFSVSHLTTPWSRVEEFLSAHPDWELSSSSLQFDRIYFRKKESAR